MKPTLIFIVLLLGAAQPACGKKTTSSEGASAPSGTAAQIDEQAPATTGRAAASHPTPSVAPEEDFGEIELEEELEPADDQVDEGLDDGSEDPDGVTVDDRETAER